MSFSRPSLLQEVLESPGQPLDSGTRSFMQSRFGHDFSQVSVHSDDLAAEATRALGALGLTVGQHVVLSARHRASPRNDPSGLLAHELTHVVQQSAASSPKGEKLRMAPRKSALEAEANLCSTWAVRGSGFEGVAGLVPRPRFRLATTAIQLSREGATVDAGSKRAKAAEHLVEKLKAAGTVYKQEKPRDWKNEKLADCTKFVQWALEASGEGELFGRGKAVTSMMQEIIRKLSVEDKVPFRLTDPKVGDILMWGGHVGIATEVVEQKGTQHLVFAHMGGDSGARLIGKSDSAKGPVYWLKANDSAKIDSMGAGAFLGFWTP
jgi:hypothetical protein